MTQLGGSHGSYSYNTSDFEQERSYLSFNDTQSTITANITKPPTGIKNSTAYRDLPGAGNKCADEPPLLEELGINPKEIFQKTLSALNPLRTHDRQQVMQDTDLAGPLAFCLTLGVLQLLSGKVMFSSIFGIVVLGCIFFHCLLSLMVIRMQVTFGMVASVLGYCLLPMVLLSGIHVFVTIQGTFGLIVTGIAIFWCSMSASKLFATACGMRQQQLLIAYPCAMFYGGFALITIF